jgi:hypothetical protein
LGFSAFRFVGETLMSALRSIAALAGDYRFTATIAFVVLTACTLRFFGAELELLAAVLLLGALTAVFEHHQSRTQDKTAAKRRQE